MHQNKYTQPNTVTKTLQVDEKTYGSLTKLHL